MKHQRGTIQVIWTIYKFLLKLGGRVDSCKYIGDGKYEIDILLFDNPKKTNKYNHDYWHYCYVIGPNSTENKLKSHYCVENEIYMGHH